MMRKSLRAMLAAVAITVVAGAFVGCGSNQQAAKTGEETKKEISGSITLAGSTALQPLAEQAGKAFTEKNPKATINVQGGGSGTGLKLVSEGTADIGNSDVTTEGSKLDAAKAKELVDHQVCVIGFAVVVNPDVKVDNLTKDQIQKIFTGEITNWKQVGGDDAAINVINRAKSSGTRATFKQTVMGGKDEKEGLGTTQDSNGNVEKAIQATKGSISYLALSYLSEDVKKNVKPVKIEGVEANKDNITTGKYPFWSYEHMYTKGEAKDLSKAFIDYMVSDENKALVEKLGYIPAGDMKTK
ncbi:phosphate ABC transporter substrate-binding protein [Clostridium sp. DJ247]|uniref:phosphate ABC transporter substrate-binding protein n=1 Tax=Clostridium sp. DJ247 TaxID=2726188 RepID=UPI001625C5BD|nr:phosphate ABC transporter substrate-binding protein [Clostridium sp. DJ247]MBC2582425.1 phosphate ABC transporter substrate-binding protein [Clostridium sp. DJ247]